MSPMKRKSSQLNFLDHQGKRSHIASDGVRLENPASALLPSAYKSHSATADFSLPSSSNALNCSTSSSFAFPYKTNARISNVYKKSNEGANKKSCSSVKTFGRRTNDFRSTSCSGLALLSSSSTSDTPSYVAKEETSLRVSSNSSFNVNKTTAGFPADSSCSAAQKTNSRVSSCSSFNENKTTAGFHSDSSCYAAQKTNMRVSSCSSFNENKTTAKFQLGSFNKFNVSQKMNSTENEDISRSCFSIMRANFVSSIPLPPSTSPLPPSPRSTVAGSVFTAYENQSNDNPSQWLGNVSQNEQAISSALAQLSSSHSTFHTSSTPGYESTSFNHYENSQVQHSNTEGRAFEAMASTGSSAFQFPCEPSIDYDNSKRNKYQRALDVSSAYGRHAKYQHSLTVSNASYASLHQVPLTVATATVISQGNSPKENCKSDSLMSLNISFKSQENGDDDVFSCSEMNNDSNSSSTLHNESTKQPLLSYPGKSVCLVNNSEKFKIFDVDSPLGNYSSRVSSRKAEPQRKSYLDVLDDVNPAHSENWNFCDIDGDTTEQKVAIKPSSSLKTVNNTHHVRETDLGSHDGMNKFETFEVPCSSSLKRLSKPFSIADALKLTPMLNRLDDPLAEGDFCVDIPSPIPISPAMIPLPPSSPASVVNDPNNITSTPKKKIPVKTSSRIVKTSLSKSAMELQKLWNKWSTSSVAINDLEEETFLQPCPSKSSRDPDGRDEVTVSAKKASRSVSMSAMPDGDIFSEKTTFSLKKSFPTPINASITSSLPQPSQSSNLVPLSSDPTAVSPMQRFWLASTAAIINSKLSASHSQRSSSTTNLSDIPDTSSISDLKPSSFHWRRNINNSAAEETSSCHYDTSTSATVANPRTAYFALEWKELASSRFSTGFIDTHCHLDFLFNKVRHNGTLDQFKQKMEDDNKDQLKFPASYEGCVAVFCQPDSFHKVWWQGTLLAEEGVWAAFGCHPHFSNRFGEQQLQQLRQALTHPKVVALGEIGLDYSHKNNHSPSVQQAVFRQQLLLAEELHLPLVIHCRDAHDDTLQILKKHVSPSTRIHHHCFADSWQEAEEWLKAFPKCFLGLTNLVTQRNSQARMVCEAVRQVPLHRLLLETDAPYFVPDCVSGLMRYYLVDSFPARGPGVAVTDRTYLLIDH